MNVWDILILLALGAAAAFALRHIVKQRKQGGCGGNCSGCSAPCAHKQAAPAPAPEEQSETHRK